MIFLEKHDEFGPKDSTHSLAVIQLLLKGGKGFPQPIHHRDENKGDDGDVDGFLNVFRSEMTQ